MTATSMQTKQRPWWMTLIMGILAFVVGAILLWAPAKTRSKPISSSSQCWASTG